MSRLSREQKRETRRAECPEPGSGTPPIEVRVPASGDGASVGGTPVAAHRGETVQHMVLDHLHRIALATGHPVRATVHDERIGYAVPLQVAVDGSSCFVDEPVRVTSVGTVSSPTGEFGPAPAFVPRHEPAAKPLLAPAPAPKPLLAPAPAPKPLLAPAPAPKPLLASAPEPAAEDDDSAPRPAPVREFGIAEVVMGALGADGAERSPFEEPSSVAKPSPFAEPIGRINEAVRAGRTEEAAELAERTTAQVSAAAGPEHPEVLWLRELSAYIAYLAGDMPGSFQLSLDLARLRHRRHEARAAYGDVQSAAAAWRAVRDPHQGLRLGRDLIEVWTELTAEAGPAADDIERLESARTRMGRLADRARAKASPEPATGANR